ncbi:hypothetical protein BLOT_009838 [Blomia tropicalis]|nr:hypothetical protein BLOT_009838 [Blomia tropicalis]
MNNNNSSEIQALASKNIKFDSHLKIFSSKSYKTLDINKSFNYDNIPNEWQLLNAATNSHNGYYGCAFWNPKNEQVAIAHRGIKFAFKPILTDILGVINHVFVSQIKSAATYCYLIQNIFNQIDESCETYFQLFITGHSLGGWLAQICTFSLKYLEPNDDKTLFASNKIGYHAHTVVFDSPGCKKMLTKVVNYFKKRNDNSKTFSIDILDINIYLSAPNRINTLDKHVGKVYRIFNSLNSQNITWLTSPIYFLKYNFITHKLKSICKAIDSETGTFKRDKEGHLQIAEVLDWPTYKFFLRCNEYNTYFKYATYKNDFNLNCSNENNNIRYHTIKFNEKECSINVFIELEKIFLEKYKQAKTSLSKELFENLVKDENLDIIDKLSINDTKMIIDENDARTIKDMYENFIPYVKRLVKFSPDWVKKIIEWNSNSKTDMDYQNLSKNYLEKLKNHNWIKFQRNDELNKTIFRFLDDKVTQVLTIEVPEETYLCLIRIYQIIQKQESLTNKNNYIITDLDGLFNRLENLDTLENFLGSKKENLYLLLVECNSMDFGDKFNILLDYLNTNPKLKIIFSNKIKNNQFLKKKLQELKMSQISEINQNIKWSDLIKHDEMLQIKIIISGYEVSLKDVINKIDETKIDEMLDFSTFIRFYKGEKVVIGKRTLDLFDLEGAYVNIFEYVNNESFKTNLNNNSSQTIYTLKEIC